MNKASAKTSSRTTTFYAKLIFFLLINREFFAPSDRQVEQNEQGQRKEQLSNDNFLCKINFFSLYKSRIFRAHF